MSTPTEPTGGEQPQANEPQAAPTAPDAPTAQYPAESLPTEAYPPAPPAATPAAYGQPTGYGQAPYGQAPYGQPAYAAAPAGPDTRPKTLAWWSVGLVAVGILLVIVGFLPLPWIGFISVIIGGLALVVAFILSIVVLASRKQGGKPLGIVALVVSVLGGGLWAVALFVSLAFGIVSSSTEAVSQPGSSTSVAPDETDADDATGDSDASGSYDQQAFLDEARPALAEVFREMEPSLTDDVIDQMFPDETLVSLGETLLLLGDAGRGQMIDTLVESGQGMYDDESAAAFIDAILDAAENHLQR